MSEENKNQSLNEEGVHQLKGEPKDKEKRLNSLRNLGIATLAVLFYLLLLDGAVETFLGGSSIRWWIGGTVATYFVLTILLWQRLGWATRAALSLFVLLGLLVATTWQPDGLSQGMILVSQPTAVVLSAITAAAIAFAFFIVVRAKVIPNWVNFIVGLFAIYGIAAFVLGIKDGIPYSTLFHGNSLWEQLPFWLQGAYVGTLFIIPAALLYQIKKAIRLRSEAFRSWAVPMLTLSLSLLIVVAGIKAPTGSIVVMNFDGGRLEVTSAKGITEENEPASPTGEFPEDAEKIYLTFKSDLTESASVIYELVAVNVEGMEPEQKVSVSNVYLSPGERGVVEFKPPRGGFSLGQYRVDIALGDSPPQSISFKVIPILPPAILVEEIEEPPGFNIALAVLGGRIESFTSEYDDGSWAAANLIDGVPFTLREGRGGGLTCKECGWSSKNDSLPQEIVFSFYQKRQALISAIVVNTETWETRQKHDRIAKHVEVWTSTANPTDGFRKIADARIHRLIGEQMITFSPTEAKYVKLRLLSNHGGRYTQVGEVKIIEAKEGTESILADFPKNLAIRVLGGAVVRYTSQYRERNGVQHLVDGRNDTKGWRSADNYLPQEFVFAFRGDREALIDQIVFNPKNEHNPATWPKLIKVSVSTKNPLDGFQEVRLCTLAQEPRDQGFPIGRKARFLKLRILENFGGNYTSLGEVKLLEGSSVDYESVLFGTSETDIFAYDTLGISWVDTVDARMEIESNDTPTEANPLLFEQFTKGVIDPLGEEDYFKFTVSGQGSILTLDLIGQPNIRTSITLLDSLGVVRKQFDPGGLPGERQTFSWVVAPSTYNLQVTEPPISLVLIWDTSGSMKGRSEDLRQAIESYLDQVQPSERLNLIRFSDDVEVLLPEFTSDRKRLKAAVQGKFYAEGFTSFYDAVAKGIELLEQLSGNRAIVVMTDGEDSASRLQYPEFWRLLDQKRIRLYTIGLGEALELQLPQLGTSCRRMLGYVALATNGRSFFAKTSEELKDYYQQILEELRTKSSYYLRPSLDRGPGYLTVLSTGEPIPGVDAPSQVELILDASGSMIYKHQKIDGRLKMEIAKDVMEAIIEGLPDDIQVALRVYGRRIREGRSGACRDSELLFPFAKIDKPRLIQQIRSIRALGTTPIAYSLQQIAYDFGNTPGAKWVILVTDGKEECGGNPEMAVSELLSKGLKLTLHVVGLALAEERVKQEMERIAELTGGKFFDAKDAKELHRAIQQAMAVSYDVLDAAGTKVASGQTGQGRIKVPEGIYTVVMHTSDEPITISNVRVAYNMSTTVELKKEGQEIGINIVGPTSELTVK